MRVLVLWRQRTSNMRNTILDNVFCFQRYDLENEYFYFNIYNGRFPKDYKWIDETMFDAVMFHCTALGLRESDEYWEDYTALMQQVFGKMPCKKIIFVQDDYTLTGRIWDFIKAVDVGKIYTVMREQDYSVLYPKDKVGNIDIETVLTGYVEESYIKRLPFVKHSARELDIVYRANKLPYDFGKLGQLKYEIVNYFKKALEGSGLLYDINNTYGEVNAILGDSWLYFLASSRTVAGCLGGAGMADFTGEYKKEFRKYAQLHKEASYEEARDHCFPGLVENLTGVISPRIFECALTKTCQVLVGNDYQGILRPNEDYIVINEDFCNMSEVIEKIKDIEYCEKIADRCYERVVASGKYSYKIYAEKIAEDIKDGLCEKKKSSELSSYINKMCKLNNDEVMSDIIKRGR